MTPFPARIGRYQVRELLGQGAMGRIYRGFDPRLQRELALKTIQPALLADSAARGMALARLRHEARAGGRVAHPGVVTVHEFGECRPPGDDGDGDSGCYIAMECVTGRSLAQRLVRQPLLAESRVRDIMVQLLDALAACHAAGVWHRDVKASNLLIADGGRVKLTDFGVAHLRQADDPLAGLLVGTPGSIAPEQYLGEAADHRADIFACGALLFRLLTGQAAYRGRADAVMWRVLNQPPPRPGALSAHSPGLDAVVARALARRPEDRFPDAAAMRDALAAVPETREPAPDDGTTVVLRPGAGDAGLAHIENALRLEIGPVARLLMQRCLDDGGAAAGPRTLVRSISSRLLDPAARQRFLRAAAGTPQPRPPPDQPGR